MGKIIWLGFQKSAENALVSTSIVMGRNLRTYKTATDTAVSDDIIDQEENAVSLTETETEETHSSS